jgi:hypothetical protein
MHLVTYGSPIALQPRKYAIGLFKTALSYQNFRETQQGVLQVQQGRRAVQEVLHSCSTPHQQYGIHAGMQQTQLLLLCRSCAHACCAAQQPALQQSHAVAAT